MSSRKRLRKTVSGYSRFRNAQSVVPRPRNFEKARIIHAGPYQVRIVGVEDLIIDRLAAAKFWKSQVDLEQAKALWKGFRKQIDLQYLRRTAREEKVEDVLP